MQKNFTCSVVLTLYNGMPFIREQLESILEQTYAPDEVLIFDDGSTDGSQDEVKQYIHDHKLDNWHFIQNKENVGWKANFIKGFNVAKGDIIFPSDQDDIWNENKISDMMDVLSNNEFINVLCCNLIPFSDDETKIDLPKYNLEKYGSNLIEQVKFNKMWMNPLRQGCTMAFRRCILPVINKVWFGECPHDLAVWAIGMSSNSLYILNEVLVKFRRHTGNNTPQNNKTSTNRIYNLTINKILATNIINTNTNLLKLNNKKEMQKLLTFYDERIKFIECHNFSNFIKMTKKIDLFPQKRAFFGDFIASLR